MKKRASPTPRLPRDCATCGKSFLPGRKTSLFCSIGCGLKHSKRIHGGSNTALYARFRMMIERCEVPSTKCYDLYGGRGIRVCDRWRNDFSAFVADVGEPPTPQHSLDRFPDNDGHYEPGNVRWATAKEQARNRRNTKLLSAFGEDLTEAEWRERAGFRSQSVIAGRLRRGWTVERAVSEPAAKTSPPRSDITAFGETKRMAEWARERGISVGNISHRISLGWDVERALTEPVTKAQGPNRSLAISAAIEAERRANEMAA